MQQFQSIVRAAFRAPMLWMFLVMTATLISPLSISPASAMDIQRVKSPGGIEAWLVESHNVPLIAMQFAFLGGSTQDPAGKEGLAYFLSGMLDEGAGDLNAQQFQERLADTAARINFDATRDTFSGSIQTLTENMKSNFELLRLALTKPRFDQQAVDRVRAQIVAGLKFDQNDPEKVASLEWYKLAFGDQPYGRSQKGTAETLATVERDDLLAMSRAMFARDNLKVAVVGDIDAKTLGKLLDEVFGALPTKSKLLNVAQAQPPLGPNRKVIEMDVPQSVALFGLRSPMRKDPDFMSAYVLNYILGGGGFASRLMEEVREKRGLAYSVYSYVSPLKHASIYVGHVATENKSVNTSLDVIQAELQRMADEGPSAEDLQNAKQYLTGSYALRFDTSQKIASQLLWVQIEDLGIDYVEKRNALVEAVTLDDVKRVAQRMLKADSLIVTIVGKPVTEVKTPG